MRKSVLPLYRTGWFYLLLSFWSGCYWYVFIGGTHFYEQYYLNWLNQNINYLIPLKSIELTAPQLYTGKLFDWHLLSGLIIFLGVIIRWFVQSVAKRSQLLILSGYLVLILVTHYLLLAQGYWLNIISIFLVLPVSWVVLSAYFRERDSVETINARYNRLLSSSLEDSGSLFQGDQLDTALKQTIADKNLIDSFYQTSLKFHQAGNLEQALKLLEWNLTSGIKHPQSQLKLSQWQSEEREKDKKSVTQTTEDAFDKTMVIDKRETTVVRALPGYPMEKFGRYQVNGVLGKGAMGVVYRGVDPKINRDVAIKTLPITDISSESDVVQSRQRFFREAETAGNLNHANIVTIYDVGEEGELGYIAMDLLTGAPLSEFVKPQNRLPAPLVYQLMIQIADALEYAHSQNVVHRDIKPGNIIFDDDIQRVTVTDFGIAYVADSSKTGSGTIVGSPYYMSPEQVSGAPLDGRSDIFSLGVTFYQLLSGYLPFTGDSIASVTYQITQSRHTPLKQWDETLPPSATRITNKAMQKKVDKRFQSMQEFKQALINALKRDFKQVPRA